jgi:tetratricopeptide (TPR) repeat protein
MTLYVTPAAAFLIGFLLLASPLGDGRGRHSGFAPTALLAALGSSILAVLLHNLIDFALFEPGVWMAFWTLVACLVAARPRQPSGDSISIRSAPVLKLIAMVVAVVLFGAYCHYVWWPVSVTTANIQRAQQAVSVGRFDVAHRHLETAAEADPLSAVAAGLNGRLYMQQYEQASQKQPALLEQAATCYRDAILRNRADYKDHENLAMAYRRLGQHEKAYDWYLRATERYGGCGRLWFELARAAEELGRADAALAAYRKAVEIEESYRGQFRQMYPEREKVISRLDEEKYRLARERIEELSK